MAWKANQLYRMAIATGIKDIKAINVEDRIIPFVGSSESLDRDNDIIMLNGWDLKNFKQNPVFLWMHNHFIPPLGRSIKTVKNKETMTLDFDIKFPDEGLDPFRDNIFNLYAGGFLKATSVGFMPKQWKYGKDTDEDFNVKFEKQELWELSGVTIPSNPDALMRAKDAGAVDGNFLEMLEKVNGEKIPYVPEPYYIQSEIHDLKEQIDAGLKDGDNTEIKDGDEPAGMELEGRFFIELMLEGDEDVEAALVAGETWYAKLEGDKDIEGHITGITLLEPMTKEDKAGAVLNRKNKKKLIDASAMINEVLDSAAAEEEETSDFPTATPDITMAKGLTGAEIVSGKLHDPALDDWEKETIEEFQTPKVEDGNSIVEMLGSDVEIDAMTSEQMKETADELVKEAIEGMTLDPVVIQDAIDTAVQELRNKRLGKNLN